MNIIAVDDEPLALSDLEQSVAKALPGAFLRGFASGGDALSFIEKNDGIIDVAFLDIQMGGMDGLSLAKALKEHSPKANIIFVTGFADYMGNAFSMHASGYLLKPVSPQAIKEELAYLRHPVPPQHGRGRIRVQCFGSFELFADDRPVPFARTKTKELFAYLIDRRGASCTVAELCAVLWEDRPDTASLRNQLRNLVSDLRRSLRLAGAEEILFKRRNQIAVDVDAVDCDYYHWLNRDPTAVNAYTGEYMAQYSWAEATIGSLKRPLP